jgi:hypothetical protein
MGLLRYWFGYSLLFVAFTDVCPAQSGYAFGPDSVATVLQLTGRVSILKDSGEWALNVGNPVQVKQIIVTGTDGYAQLQVSDGSTFEVFPNSRVTFRANPSNWKDLLDVWLGRVKIHIQKISGQPNNNRVNTPTAVISVRGTVFDVAVEPDTSTLVAVEEGLVEVQHALLPSKEPKLVSPGESLRVYPDQPLAQRGPNRDAVVQHGLRAAAEALYRILNRTATPGTGGLPGGGGSAPSPGGGQLPGDTENTPPPPPPPPSQP